MAEKKPVRRMPVRERQKENDAADVKEAADAAGKESRKRNVCKARAYGRER